MLHLISFDFYEPNLTKYLAQQNQVLLLLIRIKQALDFRRLA